MNYEKLTVKKLKTSIDTSKNNIVNLLITNVYKVRSGTCKTLNELYPPIKKDNLSIITVLLPRDRYDELEYGKVKYFPRSMLTLYKELNKLQKYYYSEKLSKKELEEVSNTSDVFGYAEIAKNALLNNETLERSEIMGDLIFYEGFSKTKDGDYVVNLGS